MPINYLIDKTRGHVRTTVVGPVTVDEILGHLEAARREQALAYTEMIDARGVAPPFLSTGDIWRAASLVRATPLQEGLGPRAVVVDNDATFGLTRMFATLLSGFFPMTVFREPEAAEQWLAGWSRMSGGG